MNKIKRLGEATALEIALAKTPVMLTIAMCILGVAIIYFAQSFTAFMTVLTLFPIAYVVQGIASDNFNGKNMLFCRQFGFTAAETLAAKLTVLMLLFSFYTILLVGALVIYDMLPENYNAHSIVATFVVTPRHMVADTACYIASALSGALFLAAALLTNGAFDYKDEKEKDSKLRAFLKKLFTVIIIFLFVFRSDIAERLFVGNMHVKMLITIIVSLCLAATLIYVSYRKMKQYMTD